MLCSLLSRCVQQSPPEDENNEVVENLNNDGITTLTAVAQRIPYLRIGNESGIDGETAKSRKANSFKILFAPLDVRRIYENGDASMEWLVAHHRLTGIEIQRRVDIEKAKRELENVDVEKAKRELEKKVRDVELRLMMEP